MSSEIAMGFPDGSEPTIQEEAEAMDAPKEAEPSLEAFMRERERLLSLPPDIPCHHPGCLSHISHPCEGCGRIGGRPPQPTPDGSVVEEIKEKWGYASSWDSRIPREIAEKDIRKLLALIEAQAKEIERLRTRLFRIRQVDGLNHSTACSIWGNDGMGNVEGIEGPFPCNCGCTKNYLTAQLEAAKARDSDRIHAVQEHYRTQLEERLDHD